MVDIQLPRGQKYDLDLGDGHVARWVNRGQFPFTPHIGLIVYHQDSTSETGWCSCAMWFSQPYDDLAAINNTRPLWTRTGDDQHLTCTPSLGCPNCKDHGFIRDGKWVRA